MNFQPCRRLAVYDPDNISIYDIERLIDINKRFDVVDKSVDIDIVYDNIDEEFDDESRH